MHDVGPENDVVPLLLQRDYLRAGVRMESDSQTAADQDGTVVPLPLAQG